MFTDCTDGAWHGNKNKSRVLHMGRSTHRYQYRVGDEGTESSPAKKDLGVLVDEKINISHQRALAARRLTVSWAASREV